MRFPKAYEGVKLIFIAEIVGLVISLLSLCFASSGMLTDPGSVSLRFAALLLLFAMLAFRLCLGYFIVFFVGLIRAKQDEPRFGTAMICVLVSIGAAFVGAFVLVFVMMLSYRATASSLPTILMNVGLSSVIAALSCGAVLCMAAGVKNLAKKLGDGGMVLAGSRFQVLVAALCGLTIVLNIASTLLRNSGRAAAVGWITGTVTAVSFVSSLITVLFLGRAKNMLAR